MPSIQRGMVRTGAFALGIVVGVHATRPDEVDVSQGPIEPTAVGPTRRVTTLPDGPPIVPDPVATKAERVERARWRTLLGEPPERPADAPTEAEVRTWLDAHLEDDEVLVALDCAMYPCYAQVVGADVTLRERLARRGFPHASAGIGEMIARDGEDVVRVGVGTISFLAEPLESEAAKRFVRFGNSAHSHRASAASNAEFARRAGDADAP